MTRQGHDEHFRVNIARLRKAWGMSQRVFADYLGVNQKLIPFWETGTGVNKENTAKTLKKHLGVTPEVFARLWSGELYRDELENLFGLTPGRVRLPPTQRGTWTASPMQLASAQPDQESADAAADVVRCLLAQGKTVWIVAR